MGALPTTPKPKATKTSTTTATSRIRTDGNGSAALGIEKELSATLSMKGRAATGVSVQRGAPRTPSSDNQEYKSPKAIKYYRNTFTLNFKTVKVLGQGSFAEVRLVQQRGVEKKFAAKVFFKPNSPNFQRDDFSEEEIVREARVMALLRKPQLVHLHAVFEEQDRVIFLLDLCEGRGLRDYLRVRRVVPRPPSKNSRAGFLPHLPNMQENASALAAVRVRQENTSPSARHDGSGARSYHQMKERRCPMASNSLSLPEVSRRPSAVLCRPQSYPARKQPVVVMAAVSEEEAAAVMADLLAALAHMHSLGIVHRDVKIDNIFLLRSQAQGCSLCDNEFLLGDFGFASRLSHDGYLDACKLTQDLKKKCT